MSQIITRINQEIRKLQQKKDRIEKSNKLFRDSTKAQRRVLIAQDVIAQLKAKKYRVGDTVYVEGFLPGDGSSELLKKYRDGNPIPLQDVVCDMTGCHVCARGAMLLSAIQKFNRVTSSQIDIIEQNLTDSDEFSKVEQEYFSEEQACLIEMVYERWDGHSSLSCEQNDKVGYACLRYSKSLSNKKRDRLIQIMKNIVRNSGEFVIPKKYFRSKNDRPTSKRR